MNWSKKYGMIIILMLIITMVSGVIVQAADEKPTQSTIGGVHVDDLKLDEVREILQLKIEEWQSGKDLEVKSDYEVLHISRTSFTFDLESSIDLWQERTKRKWYAFFLKKHIAQLPLVVTANGSEWSQLDSRINKEKTLAEVSEKAAYLQNKPSTITYNGSPKRGMKTLAKVTFAFPESVDATSSRISGKLNEQIIHADHSFSLIDAIGLDKPSNKEYISEELNFYSTALYDLFMQTNLELIEHHSQGQIPSYGKAGIEAAIQPESKRDLKVLNNNNVAYIIRSQIDEGQLSLSLKSYPNAYTYEYQLDNEVAINPRKVYRYSKKLSPGVERTVANGSNGMKVDVYRKIFDQDGILVEREFISRQSYPAEPQIILTSTKEPDLQIDENAKKYADITEELINKEYLEIDNKTNSDFISDADIPIVVESDDLEERIRQIDNIDTYAKELLKVYCEAPNAEVAIANTPNKGVVMSDKELEEMHKLNCSGDRGELEAWLKSYLKMNYLLKNPIYNDSEKTTK